MAAGDGEGHCVEQRVRRDAQRRRLPDVGPHVREGAAREGAFDGAALPAVVGPQVEQGPAQQRCAQVAGRHRLHRVSCRRDRSTDQRRRAGGASERQLWGR